MGWVSLREDTIDRLISDFDTHSTGVQRRVTESMEPNLRDALTRLVFVGTAMRNELATMLELVTDPEMDVATRVLQLEQDKDKLEKKIGATKDFERMYRETEELLTKCASEKGKLTKKLAELQDDLARAKRDAKHRRH